MNAIPVITGNSKNILLLGSGFVSRPAIELLSDAGFYVTVACRTLDKAKKQAEGVKYASATALDVSDSIALDREISKCALVISLIPYTQHASVIKSAIKYKKHVVTTSYINPAMQELDNEAKEAGITVLNEIGLDPGIDHLYALKTINEVHAAGGRILSFLSYCGGLPAPEHSDNPLGYKFSWSARGALLALRNQAKYYKDDKLVEVSADDLMNEAKPYFIYPGFSFVAYPNRDSSIYRERYSIPEARTIIRGTLRYSGFPEFVKTLTATGLLNEEENDIFKQQDEPPSWKEATAKLLGLSSQSEEEIVKAITSKSSFSSDEEKNRIISGLRWIGLFSDEKIQPRKTPLDTLCAVLENRCAYEADERDMVMLQHKFEIETKEGARQTQTSTLVDFGDPKGQAAMAKLVGVPCAVAAQLIMNDTISQKGVIAPLTAEIYEPLMNELKDKHNIFLKEKTFKQ